MGWISNLIVKITGDNRGLDDAVEGSQTKLGRFKTSILALSAAVAGTVAVAFAAFVKVMKSTEGTADKLEFAMAAVKGGYQGLMETLATGDWGGLIDNITKTAKAYKDLAAAQDLMRDVTVANDVMRARLEAQKQAARVAYQQTEDPGLRKQYLDEAINAQKQITSLNLSEIETQLKDFENFLATKKGLDEESARLMAENFRKIAMNHQLYFGEMGRYEAIVAREKELLYKNQLGTLTDAQKQELRLTTAARANLQLFQEFRNTLKPDEFNAYVATIGKYINAIAEGDQALYRLTGQLQNVKEKIQEIKREVGPEAVGGLSIPQLGTTPGAADILAPPPQAFTAIDDWEGRWQDAIMGVTDLLGDAFGRVFEAIGANDFDGVGKDILASFGSFIVNLGKMLVAYGIMKTTFFKSLTTGPLGAGAAIAAGLAAIALGSLFKGAASRGTGAMSPSSGGGGGGGYSSNGMQTIKVQVEGKIEGRDIVIAQRRFLEDN